MHYKKLKIAIATGILSALTAVYFWPKTNEEIITPPAKIEIEASKLENLTSSAESKTPEEKAIVKSESEQIMNCEDSTFTAREVQSINLEKPEAVPYNLQQTEIDEIEKNYREGATSLDCIISKIKEQSQEFKILAYERLTPLIYTKEIPRLQELLQKIAIRSTFDNQTFEKRTDSISLLLQYYAQANETDKKYGTVLQEIKSMIKPSLDKLSDNAIELRKKKWEENIQKTLSLYEKYPKIKEQEMKDGCDIDNSYLANLFKPFRKTAPEMYEIIMNKINSAMDECLKINGQGLTKVDYGR